MLGVQLLFVIMIGVFMVFRFGTNAFHVALSRQGIEGEARRIIALLEIDLLNTHFQSINIIRREVSVDTNNDGEPDAKVRRDGFCLVGMQGWADPTKFDFVTGMPLWSQYIIYYATEEEEGRMFRQIIIPPAGIIQYRLPTFSAVRNLNDAPTANLNHHSYSTLSSNALEFAVDTERSGQAINVTLKLRQKGVKRLSSGKRVDETLQMGRKIVPENTFPRL